jgi:uncharacterized membrane protein
MSDSKTVFYRNSIIIAFVVLALLMGGLFIKNVNAFSVADTRFLHFDAMYSLSTGQFFKPTYEHSFLVHYGDEYITVDANNEQDFNLAGYNLPTGYYADIRTVNGYDSFCMAENMDFDESLNFYGLSLLTEQECEPYFISTFYRQYSFVNYLPQAAGFKLGTIFNVSGDTAIIFARATNLIFYVFCFVLAFLLLPVQICRKDSVLKSLEGYILLAIIGLFPGQLLLASSLSADPITTSFLTVYICLMIRLYNQNSVLSKAKQGGVGFFTVLLFLLKPAYFLMSALILFLKKSVFPHKKLIFYGSFILGCIIYLVYGHFFSDMQVLDGDPAETVVYIFTHPIQSVLLILFNVIKIPFTLSILFSAGFYLVWFIILYAVLYYFSDFRDEDSEFKLLIFLKTHRLFVVSFCIVFVIFCVIYLAFWLVVPIHLFDIFGFQSRYLYPIMPVLLTLLYKNEAKSIK